MKRVKYYYLRGGKPLREDHRKKISLAMKQHYKDYPMTIEHRRKISEGAKRVWAERKKYWREQGWI